jgi:hypothetical protein
MMAVVHLTGWHPASFAREPDLSGVGAFGQRDSRVLDLDGPGREEFLECPHVGQMLLKVEAV